MKNVEPDSDGLQSATACSSIPASILAVAVQLVERVSAVGGARFVVGDQALDAERHVGEAAGGIEARAGDEAEVEARHLAGPPSRGAQQRLDACLAAAVADALQSLRHQVAVVGVERNHVGDRAERYKICQRA
jgi:hypothetical protein